MFIKIFTNDDLVKEKREIVLSYFVFEKGR